MFLRTETILEKKLIGLRTRLTQKTNIEKTVPLWKELMPQRHEIPNKKGTDLYSVQLFDSVPNHSFKPNTEFEKWAAVEVTSFDSMNKQFETLIIPKGMYAVFLHKGLLIDFPKTLDFIYSQWLPNSGYMLDHRPHFDVMGEKYSPTSLNSEEEIWVPITPLYT